MLKQHWKGSVALLIAGSFLIMAADAGTISYWRHEEGPAGSVVANGPGAILDSSGNGNTMRTFDNTFTAATYVTDVSPKPLRSGLANNLSLDFTPNHDNYSDDGTALKSHVFDALTVEFAFNMDSVGIGQWQVLVGKDGMPTSSVLPPLTFKVRGDDWPNAIENQLQFEFLDGAGDETSLASGFTIEAGTWYHVAGVVSDNLAELWIATDTGDYVLVDSLAGDFTGANGEVLIDANENWTVGRGFINGGIVDWADARIDEVRISDSALGTGDFLFVPEPASLVLLAFAGLIVRRR